MSKFRSLSELSVTARRLTLFAFILVCSSYWVIRIMSGSLRIGGGDEAHRMALAIRASESFEWLGHFFLDNPWGPVPFVIQAGFISILKIAGIHSLIAFSVGLSFFVFCLSVLTLTKIIYPSNPLTSDQSIGYSLIVFLLALCTCTSLHMITNPMAEIFGIFFLLLGLWVLISARGSEILFLLTSGFLFMLSSQCRNEYIILAVTLVVLVGLKKKERCRGWLKYGLIGAIVLAPTVLKRGLQIMSGKSTMSYFNLADYYQFSGSLSARFLDAITGMYHAASENRMYMIIAFTTGVTGLIFLRKLKIPWIIKALTITAIAHTIFIIFAMTAGFVLPFHRYYFAVEFLSFPMTAWLIQSLMFEKSRSVKIMGCLILTGVTFSIPAAVSNRKHTSPSGFGEAIRWVKEHFHNDDKVVIDALLFNDPMMFATSREAGLPTTSVCMVYDCSGAPEKPAIRFSQNNFQDKLLSFIDDKRPTYAFLPGETLRGVLDGTKFFYDKQEMAGYIYPLLKDGTGMETKELSLPTGLKVLFAPLEKNKDIILYSLTYMTGE